MGREEEVRRGGVKSWFSVAMASGEDSEGRGLPGIVKSLK